MTSDAARLLAYLQSHCVGRRNAIPYAFIGGQVGIRGKPSAQWRHVASLVEELRRAGHVVGASKTPPFGAYLPADDIEAVEVKETLRALGLAHLATAGAVARAIPAGQQRLFLR